MVPFDGSQSATHALESAIELARRRRSTLHLLNVEPELDAYGMVPAYLSRSAHRRSTTERARSVLAPAEARVKRARLPFESHVVWGDVAQSIVRNARRLGCDSIVMGTHGRGATANVLLGSVATKVIHLAKMPVTLVK